MTKEMLNKLKNNKFVIFEGLSKEEQDFLIENDEHVLLRTMEGWIKKNRNLEFDPFHIYRLSHDYKKEKTILEWLDLLPKGWKEDAINSKRYLDYDLDTTVSCLEKAVINSCTWGTTCAGEHDWNHMHDCVKENLPIPDYPKWMEFPVVFDETIQDYMILGVTCKGIPMPNHKVRLSKLSSAKFGGVKFDNQCDDRWHSVIQRFITTEGVLFTYAKQDEYYDMAVPVLCRVINPIYEKLFIRN